VRALTVLIAATMAMAACSEAAPAPAAASPQFDRASADLVEHGRRLSAVLGCSGCHGADLTGENWSEPGFGRLWTSNLTQAVPTYTDAQLAATIRGGTRPDGSELWEMPAHIFTQLTDDDMAAVIAFMRSRPPVGAVHPRPVFEEGARAEIAAGSFKSAKTQVAEADGTPPPDMGAEFALGRYLARATCAECHGLDLRGGTPHPGAAARPDLRMVTAYDAAQFETLMRTGEAIGDREVGLMSEVARGRFSHFTDRELRAVHLYLQKVGIRPRTDASRLGGREKGPRRFRRGPLVFNGKQA